MDVNVELVGGPGDGKHAQIPDWMLWQTIEVMPGQGDDQGYYAKTLKFTRQGRLIYEWRLRRPEQ